MKSNRYFIFFAIGILCAFTTPIFAQMMLPCPLEQRVKKAQKIVLGRIIEKHSYWDADHREIWTINLMDVRAYFKNDAPVNAERLAIITAGGFVGNQGQTVCPSFDFEVNQEYAVFLDADNPRIDDKALRQNAPNLPQCEPYASSQGVLSYIDGTYRDLMVERPMRESELFERFKAEFNLLPFSPSGKMLTARENQSSLPPLGAITGWVNGAGTEGTSGNYIGATLVANNELIINGSGFGTTPGTVEFDHVNDGNGIGSQGYAATLATDIISWSNVQIRTRIPSKAGTGIFRVKDNTATVVATSPSNINIIWSQINVASSFSGFTSDARQQTKFINADGAGGYTFQYSTVTAGGNTFSTNEPAKRALERALSTWRCATLVNFKIGTTTTSVGPATDGINSVSFNPALAANVLGSCITRFSASSTGGCNLYNTLWYVSELDIQMSPNGAGAGWNYGPGSTGSNQIDFESVMLHEIGHGHSCDHINTNTTAMYFSVSTNLDKRIASANEIACADFRIASSLSPAFCVPGFSPMSRISASICSVLPLELTQFSASALQEKGTNKSVLKWATAEEQNAAYFEVEKSSENERDFKAFTKITAKNGAEQTYEAFDENPFAGINYYRLKMVDYDGHIAYSPTKTLVFGGLKNTVLAVYPNPASNNLTLQYDTEKMGDTFSITNALGQVILKGKLNGNNIDISTLPAGIFVVAIGEAQAKFYKQ
jgi:hypothetical protein